MPKASGFTLIELIVFIIIVSVGLAGVLAALNYTVSHSADPLQPKQALNLAEGMLEEILLKNFCDPDLAAPACSVSKETSRDDYDDVQDYTGYDVTGGSDSTTLGGIPDYRVEADVTASNFCATNAAWQVTVTVTPPNSGPITLTGYRCDY